MAERERMAREIHDTLAQGFTSIVMLAQTASADLDRGRPDSGGGAADPIEEVARENLAEARALVAASAPVGLERRHPDRRARRLARRFGQRDRDARRGGGRRARRPRLGREQEVVLLRAAQEALTNVRRHAGARTGRRRAGRDGAGGRVEVGDDGVGFDPATADGLRPAGMRDRVASGGGETVDIAVGRGTRVPGDRMPATRRNE